MQDVGYPLDVYYARDRVEHIYQQTYADGDNRGDDLALGEGGDEHIYRDQRRAHQQHTQHSAHQHGPVGRCVEREDDRVQDVYRVAHTVQQERAQKLAHYDLGEADGSRQQRLIGLLALFFREAAHRDDRDDQHDYHQHREEEIVHRGCVAQQTVQVEEHTREEVEHGEDYVSDSRVEI